MYPKESIPKGGNGVAGSAVVYIHAPEGCPAKPEVALKALNPPSLGCIVATPADGFKEGIPHPKTLKQLDSW
tara:strand:+ start:1226 stop:1441 length:216 start_codon:yes stop_codon:yes gene_type:complete